MATVSDAPPEEAGQSGGSADAATCWQTTVEVGRMILATVLHGLGTGVIGIFICVLIRTVQIWSYGNHEDGFLEVAMEAQPYRRMLCAAVGGVFGAVAWYWLRGLDTTFVSVEDCIKGGWMPPGVTLVNGMIQDIVVALGGSFGREAAPREIAAMWGCVLSECLAIKQDFRKILIACGAGAGLAAVYSVPISGIFYTVEHLLAWNVSFRALAPAIVTSLLATYVASVVVNCHGLYAMRKVSYSWPSLGLVCWAVLSGPLCAVAALTFRRLVKFAESMKPQARLALSYRDATEGQAVRINSVDQGGRCNGIIVEKRPGNIRVRFDNREEDYNQVGWSVANPEGRRDWKILVAMPTIFLILGILSHDFPSLLGNGRALAEVAIGRERTCGFFVMLLFLKALVTSGSIGAGAAGGTLTPSVALGATLGAIVGETLQYAVPMWAPENQDDAPMSVITAAAFLGVAMRSPVTSIWLMMEFSAQGIDHGDLLAALRGDFQPLIDSKFAIGMLFPVAIAVASAHLTVQAINKLYAILHPPAPLPSTPPPTGRQSSGVRSSSMDLDLGLKNEENEGEFTLDDRSRDVCYTTFGIGLVLNTCLTVGVAAAAPSCHATVTKVSALGVLAAAAAGFAAWFYHAWRRRSNNFEPLMAADSEDGLVKDSRQVCAVDAEPGGDDKVGYAKLGEATSPRWSSQWQLIAMSLTCSVLVAVAGAVVPLAPWVLHVWHDVGGGLTALAVSTTCAATAAACGAAMNSLRADAAPVAAVGKEVVCVATAAAAAGVLGIVWRLFCTRISDSLSISC